MWVKTTTSIAATKTAMYLIDTNVISEARKGLKANSGVRDFFQTTDPGALYLPVQAIGEIRRGLEFIRYRGDIPQATLLEAWLDLLVADYGDRILAFDEVCAQVWGRLMVPHREHPVDKQIAAIGLVHGLTVVTRNTEDFRATGVALKNPFG